MPRAGRIARLFFSALTLWDVVQPAQAWRNIRAVNASSYSSSSSLAEEPPLTGSLAIQIGVGCSSLVSYPSDEEGDAVAATADEPRFTYVVENAVAAFISLHFARFRLPANDYIVIRPIDGSDAPPLKYYGRDQSDGFFSRSLHAKAVRLELYTTGRSAPQSDAAESNCVGFFVDNYRFLGEAGAYSASSDEAVCGADDSGEAACFQSYPDVFQRADAVARLLIHKPDQSYFCTGWLLGCEGHLITNHHCISEPQHALRTEVEFRAQGRECATRCDSPFACEGRIRTTSAHFVFANEALDYALVKLPVPNIHKDYGYLQFRAGGAVKNERIYVPQHPSGWGKRVAIKDGTNWGKVLSLTRGGCLPNQVAYGLDTQGGSSGSPVLAWTDNTVVALHHCGGCPNSAVNANKIVADLKKRGLLPNCAVAGDGK